MASLEGSQGQAVSFNGETCLQSRTIKSSVQDALEVNKKLQLLLTERVERLERELKEADRLLDTSNVDEGDDDPEAEVLIPGAKKPTGLFTSNELLSESSPFYKEAAKRSTYIANTTPHPMKAKELETLASAVRQENERLNACARLQSDSGSTASVDVINNIQGLDWNRIAEKVSGASSVKRNPTECRITWIGDRHPRINHAEWSTAEVEKLDAIVSEYVKVKKPIDWVEVAETLGTNRTPIDCMRHGLPPQRHFWNPEADQKLIKAVQTCGIDNWQLVARNVSEYATAGQCQGRWQKTLNPDIRRGAWTEEEDELLRKAVAGYGKSWTQVSTVIPGRTNDQCRERWTEYVSHSSAKITWSEAEDKNLIDLVEELGKQWKSISLRIGGNKTGQNCRMRYDKLKRPIHSKGSARGTSSLSVVNYVGPINNDAVRTRPPSVECSETGSSVITFSTNLGQHSFSQTSEPLRSNAAAVDTIQPISQAAQISSPEGYIPPDNDRGPQTTPTESTDSGLANSNQSHSIAESDSSVKKRRKKTTTKTPVPDPTNFEKAAVSTKPRPRPRPSVTQKAVTEVARLGAAAMVEYDSPNSTFFPASTTNSPNPAISIPAKPSGITRGRKRKVADGAELEVDKSSQKKSRTLKSANDQATNSGATTSKPSINAPGPETDATTIDMRISTASRSGNLDNGPDNHLEPSGSTETQPLRRGRSRRLLPESNNNIITTSASSTPSAAHANLIPKRPRGRPRKIQTTT